MSLCCMNCVTTWGMCVCAQQCVCQKKDSHSKSCQCVWERGTLFCTQPVGNSSPPLVVVQFAYSAILYSFFFFSCCLRSRTENSAQSCCLPSGSTLIQKFGPPASYRLRFLLCTVIEVGNCLPVIGCLF